jgi:hypothetical protein
MIARRALRIYLLTIVVLTALAILIVGERWLVQHRPYPYNNIFFIPSELFSDLYHYSEKCQDFRAGLGFHGGEEPRWHYPAPSAYVQCFLLNDTPNPILVLAFLTAAVAGSAALLLWRAAKAFPQHRTLVNWTIVGMLITSYPFGFSLDRGQMEPIMMGFTLLFLVFFIREKYLLAALNLALAASIKPYAAVFFMMLLFRRRFREVAIAAAAFAVFNYVALAGFGTPFSESYRDLQTAMAWFVETRASAIVPAEIGFDHGLFSVIKQVGQHLAPETEFETDAYRPLYLPYFFAAALVGLFTLYRIRRMPVLNQFFALTVAIVLLPWVSYDYTLMELYLPWGLFVIYLLENDLHPDPRMTLGKALLILLPCAIAFTPQSYLLGETVGYGGQVKAIALLVLFVSTLVFPMPVSLFREAINNRNPLREVAVP